MGITEFFETHKKGSFHSQLGVPPREIIPLNLLYKIENAHEGELIYNEYHITKAKKFINVTPLMKKKARFLINLRGRLTANSYNRQIRSLVN